jgi:hypothetical protein
MTIEELFQEWLAGELDGDPARVWKAREALVDHGMPMTKQKDEFCIWTENVMHLFDDDDVLPLSDAHDDGFCEEAWGE